MIDPKELRRFNMLHYCDKPVYVLGIHPATEFMGQSHHLELGYYLDSVGFQRHQNDENLKPIALDSSILIRAGWQYLNGRTDGDMTRDTSTKMDVDFIGGVMMIKSHYENMTFYRALPWIKSLHHLQNFWHSFQGEELVIKD
jgi:hypothetical protein